MIRLTYDTVREIHRVMNYSFFDDGDFNLNIGFVRESDEFTNKLSDTMYIAYRELNVKRIITVPATTKAGISPALLNPKAVPGMRGVAVLKAGQYKSSYKFVDSFVGWLKFPYFQQVKNVEVWRDSNGDTKVDKMMSEVGMFGINIHRMTNIGISSGVIGNYSEGCLGPSSVDLASMLPIIRRSAQHYGDTFTITVLEKSNPIVQSKIGSIQ